MTMSKTHKSVTVRTAKQLGRALGLSAADTAEMEFRSELTVALAKIIQAGRLTDVEIAEGRRHVENTSDRDCEWEHPRCLDRCAHQGPCRNRLSRRNPSEEGRHLR